MWGVGINPTLGAAEYLRSGNLKAIAGYTDLIANAPGLTWLRSAQNNAANPYVANAAASARYANGQYYMCPASGQLTTCSALQTVGTYSQITNDLSAQTLYDLFPFNSRMIHCQAVNGAFTINVSTATNITAAANCGAVNSAGTLGFVASRTDATIYTSTDGAAWGSASATGGASSCYFAVWQPVSSTFAVIASGGGMHTSANCTAWTARTTPSGVTAVAQAASAASDYSAATANVTLFSVMATFNGVANTPVLIRSTDGVNFSAVTWASLLGFTPGAAPKLVTDGTNIFAFHQATRYSDASRFYKTTDNGLTWVNAPMPVNTTGGITEYLMDFRPTTGGAWLALPNNSHLAASAPFTVASLTPSHVGIPIESYYTSSSGVYRYDYARIK